MSPRLDDLIHEAIYSRSGKSVVDLPTILERVDSAERWVLTFDELDGGLRRLSEAGRISEVTVGRYVSTGPRRSTRPYSGISEERYEAAVAAYRTSFAVDAEWLMRWPPFRAIVAFYRGIHRISGGRVGLAPGWVDLDAVAIAFSVERVIGPLGGIVDDLALEGDVLVVPMLEGDVPFDRSAVIDAARAALRDSNVSRVVVLRFGDRDEVVAEG